MEARLLTALQPLSRLTRLLPYCGWLFLAFWIIINAWVAEDAYITFRVIDNFLHGYGLRWNVHERVQVYTHPLWMLIQIPFGAAFGNVFLANIMLSLMCTLGALWLVFTCIRRPALSALVFFFMPLWLSKAFMDYSASGLENALSFLLFACFGHVLVNLRNHRNFWLYASLSVALALLNRLDVLLIYLPTLIYLARSRWQQIRWQQLFLGATPLFYWLLFAFFYYGFIFPNTKYAKLSTDLSSWLYLKQGLLYIKTLAVQDMQSLIIMLAAMALLIPRLARRLPKLIGLEQLPQTLVLGVLLYTLYTIIIGGDYMAGRFWAMPVFVSVWMLYVFAPVHKRLDIAFVALCALTGGYYISQSLTDIRRNCPSCISMDDNIIDAAMVFGDNRFFEWMNPPRIRTEGNYSFATQGRKLADKSMMEEDLVKKLYFIGMNGYYAGPKAQLIDELALADPLLARLPASKTDKFRVSHYRRDIPKGYPYALKTGSLQRMNPALANYYDKLRLITSGELFDRTRLKTIILFNLGFYEHFKEKYVKRTAK